MAIVSVNNISMPCNTFAYTLLVWYGDCGVVCSRILTLCVLQFTEAVVNLKFDEEPKYAAYSSLFESLCGATAARPILQTDAPKVRICICSLTTLCSATFGQCVAYSDADML